MILELNINIQNRTELFVNNNILFGGEIKIIGFY